MGPFDPTTARDSPVAQCIVRVWVVIDMAYNNRQLRVSGGPGLVVIKFVHSYAQSPFVLPGTVEGAGRSWMPGGSGRGTSVSTAGVMK